MKKKKYVQVTDNIFLSEEDDQANWDYDNYRDNELTD